MYKVTGDAVLYGDTVLARSFFDAVDVASTICRAAGFSLVSVMPLSLYRRLDLNKLTPTEISLQMADKSTAIPVGI